MKKILVIVLIIVLALALCFILVACNKGGGNDKVSTGVSFASCAEELGLKNLTLKDGSFTTIYKIGGEPVIYSLETLKDDVNFNVRIAKAADENDNSDISGISFSGAVENVFFDSANAAVTPTVNATSDGERAVASCNWNGYLMTVSAKKLSVTEIQAALIGFCSVISTDNIA